MQNLAREEESTSATKLHNELMNVHANEINKVCKKLKQIRGDNSKSLDIPLIETLCGTYEGVNVLEGFCANTEILCNENKNMNLSEHEFHRMCQEDNSIIFELTNDEIKIPHMTLIQLKDIIFKRLKLNKACDIFKLTVEQLRNVCDKSLSLIL